MEQSADCYMKLRFGWKPKYRTFPHLNMCYTMEDAKISSEILEEKSSASPPQISLPAYISNLFM